MTALIPLVVILAVVALAAFYGVDSRLDRPGRQY
jgi:nitrogen fixation-related uncharacterized protein